MMKKSTPHPQKGLTAAIIAGGKSRRFGAPKALAQLGNRRLLDYALDLAAAIAPKILLNWNDVNPDSISVETVADKWQECGPLGGIHAVLHAATTPWVAILPCDMPLLAPVVYQFLWRHRQPDVPVVAISQRGMEPLVAVWPKKLSRSPVLEEMLQTKRLSLRAALKSLNCRPARVCEMPDYRPAFFTNVNYPQDLLTLQRFFTNPS